MQQLKQQHIMNTQILDTEKINNLKGNYTIVGSKTTKEYVIVSNSYLKRISKEYSKVENDSLINEILNAFDETKTCNYSNSKFRFAHKTVEITHTGKSIFCKNSLRYMQVVTFSGNA